MLSVNWFRYPAIVISIVGLALWLFVFFKKIAPQCEWWQSALVVLISVLAASCFALVPDVANWLAQFLGDRAAAIMMPDEKFDKPPLSYLLARKFTRQCRWAEAADEYQLILRYYPHEEDAARELIDVANKLGDRRLAEKARKRLAKIRALSR